MSGDPFFPGSQQFQVPPTIPRAPMFANSMPPQPMPPMPSDPTPFMMSAPPAMFGEGESPFYRRPGLGPMPPMGPPDFMGPPPFFGMPMDPGKGKGELGKGAPFPFVPQSKGKGKGEWDMMPPPYMMEELEKGKGKGKGKWDMMPPPEAMFPPGSMGPVKGKGDMMMPPGSIPFPKGKGKGEMQFEPRRKVIDTIVHPPMPAGPMPSQLAPPMSQGPPSPPGNMQTGFEPTSPLGTLDAGALAPGTMQVPVAMPPPTMPRAIDDEDPLLQGVTPRSEPPGTIFAPAPPPGTMQLPPTVLRATDDDPDATSNVGYLGGPVRQALYDPPKPMEYPRAFVSAPQPYIPTLPPLPVKKVEDVENVKVEISGAQKAINLFQLQQFVAYMFTLLCFVIFSAPTIMCLHLAQDHDVAFWIGRWGNMAWLVPIFLIGQHMYHTWMISKSENRRRYLFIIVPVLPCVLFMFIGGTYMSFSSFLYGQLKSESCSSTDYLSSKFRLQEAYDEAHGAWEKCVSRQRSENEGMPLRRIPVLQSCKEWVEMESEDKTPIPWKGYEIPQGQIRPHNPDNSARWQYLANTEVNHVCGGFCEAGPPLWVSYRDTGLQGGPCSQYVAFRFLSVMHTATIVFAMAVTMFILSFPIYFSSRSYLAKMGYLSDGTLF